MAGKVTRGLGVTNKHAALGEQLDDLCRGVAREVSPQLCWVRGHSNIEGNEVAERVADRGAKRETRLWREAEKQITTAAARQTTRALRSELRRRY